MQVGDCGTFNREKEGKAAIRSAFPGSKGEPTDFWKERHHEGWLYGPWPDVDEGQDFLAQALVHFTHMSDGLSFLLLFLLLATLV